MAYRSSFDDEFEGMDELLPSNEELRIQSSYAKRAIGKWAKNHARAMKKVYSSDEYRRSREIQSDKLSIPIITPYGEFKSVTVFEKLTGIAYEGKKKVFPHLYYKKQDGPAKAPTQKVYYSPFKIHYQKIQVYREAQKNNEQNSLEITELHYWFKKMSTLYPNDYYVKIEPKRDWEYEEYVKNCNNS